MKIMAFLLLYLVSAFASMPPLGAATSTIVVAVAALACLKLAGADGFRWFAKHKWRGLSVLGIFASTVGIGVMASTYSPLAIACQSILLFLWFWLFALLSARFSRRS